MKPYDLRLFLHIYVCMYVHVIKISDKLLDKNRSQRKGRYMKVHFAYISVKVF